MNLIQMTIISTTVGKNPFWRNGVAFIVNNKSPKCSTWVQSQKWQNDLCFFSQGKPFNIMVFQVYASTTNGKDAEVEQSYEDLQDLLELTPKKMSFSS